MNVFSRVQVALSALLTTAVSSMGLTGRLERPQAPVDPKRFKKAWGAKNAPGRSLKLWSNSGRPIFGPAAQPERANHHLSRQTCRAYLRTLMFAWVSQGNPLMPRRHRRRMARLFACLEYRRMMADPTNAVDPETEALYAKMTAMQVAA